MPLACPSEGLSVSLRRVDIRNQLPGEAEGLLPGGHSGKGSRAHLCLCSHSQALPGSEIPGRNRRATSESSSQAVTGGVSPGPPCEDGAAGLPEWGPYLTDIHITPGRQEEPACLLRGQPDGCRLQAKARDPTGKG